QNYTRLSPPLPYPLSSDLTVNPQLLLQEPTPLDRRVEEYERQIITEALNIHQGRINEVAEYLQIPRKKLYLRMKKYGLSKEHYKF
ncbi:hypothetical protein MJI95_09225, partial [Salmonella enterica subsp. enterica serovar Kentucky]|nr:hypothetical protein [Salmonella enterica subsp. enterica serovar Kentucky]